MISATSESAWHAEPASPFSSLSIDCKHLTDILRLLASLFAASLIHGLALSQGFSFASAVTGDIDARLRPLIVAQP